MSERILLADRGVIAVSGPDAAAFLDNILTNDMALLDRQPAMLAGLLTPQGKILFEMLVVRAQQGYWLDTHRAKAAELAKRLAMYRLRSRIEIADLSARSSVVALAGGEPPAAEADSVALPDPRHPGLGWRLVSVREPSGPSGDAGAHDRLRVALGIGEAGRDYVLGDTFPHEANWDRIGGVSFSKGCFVGQEVVARMQHKTIVRKRIVRLTAGAALAEGSPIVVGTAEIGRVGTVAGPSALAMLRLDRALEAATKGETLTASGVAVTPDPGMLSRYIADTAEREARSKAPL